MKVYKYIIPGNPISETKVLDAKSPRVWDEYKQKRFNFKQNLRNQCEDKPLIKDPIIIDATFYFAGARNPPSIHSLYNFIDHALRGIIYKSDNQILETNLKKMKSENARTEITIKRTE